MFDVIFWRVVTISKNTISWDREIHNIVKMVWNLNLMKVYQTSISIKILYLIDFFIFSNTTQNSISTEISYGRANIPKFHTNTFYYAHFEFRYWKGKQRQSTAGKMLNLTFYFKHNSRIIDYIQSLTISAPLKGNE